MWMKDEVNKALTLIGFASAVRFRAPVDDAGIETLTAFSCQEQAGKVSLPASFMFQMCFLLNILRSNVYRR